MRNMYFDKCVIANNNYLLYPWILEARNPYRTLPTWLSLLFCIRGSTLKRLSIWPWLESLESSVFHGFFNYVTGIWGSLKGWNSWIRQWEQIHKVFSQVSQHGDWVLWGSVWKRAAAHWAIQDAKVEARLPLTWSFQPWWRVVLSFDRQGFLSF